MDDIANTVTFAVAILGLFAYLSVRAWTNRPRCDHPDLEAKLAELVRTLTDLNARQRDTRP